jgi:predicted site-specific integrase-resolvase
MEQPLLSKKQLAKRWEISISTLDRRIREGLISPVKGHKTPKFNMDDVLKAEGTDNSKLSPFERRRLEKEKSELEQRIVELEEENRRIKRQLTNVVAEIMPILKEA